MAPKVDNIYFALLALCGTVAILIFLVAAFFCIRYRRGTKVDRTPLKGSPIPLEITWTAIPLFIFIGIFFWAAEVFFGMSRPPADATEIYVVGKQWMWKIQHPDGRREINELHLPVGQPVKLIMTSQDVIHDFFVPGFRTKQDVVPPLHDGVVHTDAAGPVSHFLFAILRNQPCANGGNGLRAGARRAGSLAGAAAGAGFTCLDR